MNDQNGALGEARCRADRRHRLHELQGCGSRRGRPGRRLPRRVVRDARASAGTEAGGWVKTECDRISGQCAATMIPTLPAFTPVFSDARASTKACPIIRTGPSHPQGGMGPPHGGMGRGRMTLVTPVTPDRHASAASLRHSADLGEPVVQNREIYFSRLRYIDGERHVLQPLPHSCLTSGISGSSTASIYLVTG